jgi:hypothetical protein
VFNVFNFQTATAVDQNYTFSSVLPVKPSTGINAGNLKPEDVFNVDTEEQLKADELNPNFKKATAYQAPRQIRFGLKYTF